MSELDDPPAATPAPALSRRTVPRGRPRASALAPPRFTAAHRSRPLARWAALLRRFRLDDPRSQAASIGARPDRSSPNSRSRDVRTGQLHRLSDHRGRVVAIVFTGTACPIGELYFPRLNALAEEIRKPRRRFSGDQFQRERIRRRQSPSTPGSSASGSRSSRIPRITSPTRCSPSEPAKRS